VSNGTIKMVVAASLVLPVYVLKPGFAVEVDPTMPVFLQKKIKPKKNPPTPKFKKLEVTSTLLGAHRSIAIINDQVVTVGDEVEAAVVLAISPGRVTLRRAGKVMTLDVSRKNIKRQSLKEPVSSERVGN